MGDCYVLTWRRASNPQEGREGGILAYSGQGGIFNKHGIGSASQLHQPSERCGGPSMVGSTGAHYCQLQVGPCAGWRGAEATRGLEGGAAGMAWLGGGKLGTSLSLGRGKEIVGQAQ